MVIVERMIQKVRPGKWAELEMLETRYKEAESRLGFPPKKRYQCMVGGHDLNTLIVERQWESMAAMEATHEKAFADPEHQALNMEISSVVKSAQIEIYAPLP